MLSIRRMTVCVLMMFVWVEAAQSAAREDIQEAIDAIESHATEICGTFERDGSSVTVSGEGGIRVVLGAYLKKLTKILEKLEISVGGSVSDSEFTNVLQKDLVEELRSTRECRLAIAQKLADQTFRENACRIESRMAPRPGYNLYQQPGYNLLDHIKPASYAGCESICLKRDDCRALAFRQVADGGHQQECHLYGEPIDRLKLGPYSVITSAYKEEYLTCKK
ncbi:hypothetical protein [Pacificispira sp.]|uniref:hypothetical protein n=1 Tax=Pacificispira sp. TaxID=2888761 RepID=UPI003B516035